MMALLSTGRCTISAMPTVLRDGPYRLYFYSSDGATTRYSWMHGMTSSPAERPVARAVKVVVTPDAIVVDLVDGRTISAPVAWYPRLLHGTPAERNHWELIGDGEGIHWPDLDEDIEVDGLVAGARSGESANSLQRWLDKRTSTTA